MFFQSDFAETRPYQLQLDLSDVKRTTPSVVDGQQPISDLSAFPHIRQGGDNMAMVRMPAFPHIRHNMAMVRMLQVASGSQVIESTANLYIHEASL